MKYIPLFFLFLISSACFAQDGLLPLNSRKQVYYSDVAELPKTKEKIYTSVQDWIRHAFGNYENAVTSQDPASGTLVISSYTPVSHSMFDHIRFELTIVCKDNQYQASIEKLDGVAQTRSPKRFSAKDNDEVAANTIILKAETARRKKEETEAILQNLKNDNDQINNAMYKLLAGLKEFVKER